MELLVVGPPSDPLLCPLCGQKLLPWNYKRVGYKDEKCTIGIFKQYCECDYEENKKKLKPN